MNKKIKTQWRVNLYDVWGNEEDGWEVNNFGRENYCEVMAEVAVYNKGLPNEFLAASLTDAQIKEIFGIDDEIAVGGDDIHYIIDGAKDGYPYGSMYCVSHESLSPIRETKYFAHQVEQKGRSS
jgi:hypothetical protein